MDELTTQDHEDLLSNESANRHSWLFTVKESVEYFGEEFTKERFHLKELPGFNELKTK
jgi:hypothetical protein